MPSLTNDCLGKPPSISACLGCQNCRMITPKNDQIWLHNPILTLAHMAHMALVPFWSMFTFQSRHSSKGPFYKARFRAVQPLQPAENELVSVCLSWILGCELPIDSEIMLKPGQHHLPNSVLLQNHWDWRYLLPTSNWILPPKMGIWGFTIWAFHIFGHANPSPGALLCWHFNCPSLRTFDGICWPIFL